MKRSLLLAFALCLAIITTGIRLHHRFTSKPLNPRHDYAACDEHSLAPCLAIDPHPVEMILEETVRYDVGSKLSNLEWLSTRAPWGNGGYVRLGADHSVYGIAMVHQLHCVEMLARALADATTPMATPPHIAHCLQYLKQLFLCATDTTLEPYDFASHDFAACPVGAARTCRDWAAVYDAADENYGRWTAHVEASANASVPAPA
ncbi:hypothetical protein PsYK624_079260 [Phanerochaete sordida]|uniref:Oxidase ustYa n=1 Tax=Phanerochaete sordida TaxID=48140 RepID=A0A9P3GBT6_9APHY|nr:hypothetical protein PsYK624_079260 [Phanerochaete sordida]